MKLCIFRCIDFVVHRISDLYISTPLIYVELLVSDRHTQHINTTVEVMRVETEN